MSEQNKMLTGRLWEAVNQRDRAALQGVCAANYIHHDPGLPGKDLYGLDNYLAAISGFFTAFPDCRIIANDILAEGDKVVTRWSFQGTHQGPMGDIPATGKSVSFEGITVFLVANKQLVEGWTIFDALGLMQQLNPAP